MKLKQILLIGLCIIILTGCNNDKKYEKKLQNATQEYYSDYILNKIKNLNKIEITLGDLRKLKINIEGLEKCKDDTKVIATIRKQRLTSYKYILNCK